MINKSRQTEARFNGSAPRTARGKVHCLPRATRGSTVADFSSEFPNRSAEGGSASGGEPLNREPLNHAKTDGRVQPASGFTLVEVMVCSVIFVIFCVFFLNAAFMSMRSQQLACDYYKAMTIARNRIQRVQQFAYSSIPLTSENQVPVDGKGNITSAGIYRRTTLVSTYTNGTPNLLQITVQVHYPGARRSMSAKPVELSILITSGM